MEESNSCGCRKHGPLNSAFKGIQGELMKVGGGFETMANLPASSGF